MTRLVLLSLCLAGAVADAAAQSTVTGRVVAASNGAVLRRAHVSIVGAPPAARAVLTDDEGRFTMRQVGTAVRLMITKGGYATQIVPAATTETPLVVQLAAAGIMTGRVIDRYGDPVVGARITATREEAVSAPHAPPVFLSEADDRGEYRIGGMPAGRYQVTAAAVPPAAAARLGTTTPGPASAPRVVEVVHGDEAGGVDFVTEPTPNVLPPGTEMASAYTPGPGALVRGRILGADGRPVANAVVRAMRNGAPIRAAETDAEGRYTLTGLAPGEWRIEALRTGFVSLQYGQTTAAQPGKSVRVADGETVERIDIALPRGSVVEGTIVDENGEPLQGAVVQLLQLRYLPQASRQVAMRASGVLDRQTDDRGRYRFSGVLPGSYIVGVSVEATPPPGAATGYAPLYFPGTPDLDSGTPVMLDVGRDRVGVDVVFVPSPAVRIAGRAVDSTGKPLRGMVVLAVSQRSGSIAPEPRRATPDPDGRFAFENVPHGDYVVQALATRGDGPVGSRGMAEFGVQFVPVAGPTPDVLVRTSAGSTVAGRVIVEGAGEPNRLASSVMPFPTDFDYAPLVGGSTFSSSLSADRIRTSGLFGPMQFTLRAAADNLYLRSVTINGRDVTDTPFDFGSTPQEFTDAEFVIANTAASLAGRVTDDRGRAVSDYAALVFPTRRDWWTPYSRRVTMARPAQDGSFRIAQLPPGDYWIVAVERVDALPGGAGEWQRADSLAALSADARRITIAESEAATVTLPLVRR